MKKLILFLVLSVASPAFAADEGLFFRADCNVLSPVANKTLCQQTATTVDRSAGFYSWNGSSWVTISGTGGAGTPGGADTQVQYNSLGSFAGDAGLTYNDTTNALTATTFIGALTGNATTATALAANGANCTSGNYPLGVDASGAVENCTPVTAAAGGNDTEVQYNNAGSIAGDPGMTYNAVTNVLTVTGGVTGTASLATALAANGANCSAGSAPRGVDASGAVEDCAAYLPIAGGTLTGQLVTDNLGIEFEESDTNPTCAAGNYNIYADLSETKFKKCTNGVATDLSPAEADTLASVINRGRSDTTATSAANSIKFGDTNWQIAMHGDASDGAVIQCYSVSGATYNQCNHTENIASGFSKVLLLNGVTAETISSAGAHAYASGFRPLRSAFIPAGALSTDGTQCAAPAEVTINSGSKRWTIICADNDASTIYGEFDMPDAWDGGTVTLMGRFVQTAADTANLNADVAMACRGDGITINNTWGTEIAMDTAMTGSSATDTVTTAAITPNGTCTGGGKLLQFRWQMDAAGTTTAVATLHVLGFKLEYSVNSRSD